MKRLARRLPSPALLVAMLAVVLAVTGTGNAAFKAVVAKDSDTVDKIHASKTPKPNKLLPLDKKGKLPASVLTLRQGPPGLPGIKGDAGPQGLPGDKGDKGDRGAAGATNVVVRQGAETTITAGHYATVTAACQAGERATGGGWSVWTGGGTYEMEPVDRARPTPWGQGSTPTGWEVTLRNLYTSSQSAKAYVICAAP